METPSFEVLDLNQLDRVSGGQNTEGGAPAPDSRAGRGARIGARVGIARGAGRRPYPDVGYVGTGGRVAAI